MPKNLRDGGFRSNKELGSEDADPRVGLVNLADVMLVFACGLMLALVSYWNLDVTQMSEVTQSADVTEVTDIDELTDQNQSSGSGYTELGKVYEDPMTGKLYMLTEDVNANESHTPQDASAGENAAQNTE